MKYYIATTLLNAQAHNEFRNILNAQGHDITYDWTIHGPCPERIKEVCQLELDGVQDVDFVVVLKPGGRGTHVELGYALALQIPVFLYSSDACDYEATKETCAFYHHPLVTKEQTIGRLIGRIEEFCKGKH